MELISQINENHHLYWYELFLLQTVFIWLIFMKNYLVILNHLGLLQLSRIIKLELF
jgi:hypothetical protein